MALCAAIAAAEPFTLKSSLGIFFLYAIVEDSPSAKPLSGENFIIHNAI
jgi:hypothetical protein